MSSAMKPQNRFYFKNRFPTYVEFCMSTFKLFHDTEFLKYVSHDILNNLFFSVYFKMFDDIKLMNSFKKLLS